MVWIKRPEGREHQEAFKLRDMEKPIEWSENGKAQTTEHDAEVAIEAGFAEPIESDDDSEDADGGSESGESDAAEDVEGDDE